MHGFHKNPNKQVRFLSVGTNLANTVSNYDQLGLYTLASMQYIGL